MLIPFSNITNLKNATFYTNNNPHKNHYTNNFHKNHLSIKQNIQSLHVYPNLTIKKIKKRDFYNKNKKIFNINDIYINKILVSKKETYGKCNSFKYFIGYNDNDVIRPLYLFIPQTIGYIKKKF